MFENIGKKIKNLASVICWIDIIASLIIGIFLFNFSVFAGLIIILLGSLMSWIGSFFMYGFGELIDKTCDIEINTRSSNFMSTKNDQRIQKNSQKNNIANQSLGETHNDKLDLPFKKGIVFGEESTKTTEDIQNIMNKFI